MNHRNSDKGRVEERLRGESDGRTDTGATISDLCVMPWPTPAHVTQGRFTIMHHTVTYLHQSRADL